MPLQALGERAVAGGLVVGVQQDQEQGRGVDGAVVAAVRDLPEVGEFALADLVHDAAGLFAAERVVGLPLGGGGAPSVAAAVPGT